MQPHGTWVLYFSRNAETAISPSSLLKKGHCSTTTVPASGILLLPVLLLVLFSGTHISCLWSSLLLLQKLILTNLSEHAVQLYENFKFHVFLLLVLLHQLVCWVSTTVSQERTAFIINASVEMFTGSSSKCYVLAVLYSIVTHVTTV